ncbi:MAG: response regulator transcription factor [Verrucomicrobiales bacterium]|nr:response regulator transcription factor [Verrucomicrobiales bacterium]
MKLAVSVREALAAEGFEVTLSKGSTRLPQPPDAAGFRVIVLDVSSGGAATGMTFLHRLRSSGNMTPVLLLVPSCAVGERVAVLQAGADDCLQRPFDLREMSARVEALARRNRKNGNILLQVADLTMDPAARSAWRGERTIAVARLEYRLLEFLARHQGTICSRVQLLEKVWDYSFLPETNLVDVTIRRLRNKLDLPHEVPLLHTIRSEGYVLRPPREGDRIRPRRTGKFAMVPAAASP